MNCAGQSFPYISLLNVLLLKMFYFLLPMSYTRLRALRQYEFVCDQTIATYIFIYLKKVESRCWLLVLLQKSFHQPNSEFTPVLTIDLWCVLRANSPCSTGFFMLYIHGQKKRKFYLYLRKFRWDRLQSHI